MTSKISSAKTPPPDKTSSIAKPLVLLYVLYVEAEGVDKFSRGIMNWFRRLLSKKELDRKLDSELRDHFERRLADNRRAGMNEAQARREAALKFGGLEQVKEECRDARGTVWLESILQDLRYALRTLRKTPGFTIAVIGTLSLGIGANTAIFQLIDAVRLRSLPIPDPQQLVAIQVSGGNRGMGISDHDTDLTYPLWQQIRTHHEPLSHVLAWASDPFVLGSGADHWHARGLWVSGGMFSALGVPPYRGRVFIESDDRPGCGVPGAVISYRLWQGRFGGRDSAIGSKLLLNGHAIEILGVTPPGFFGLEVGTAFDFALPICSIPALFPGDQSLVRRDDWWLNVMGRLKDNWSLARASSYFAALSPGFLEATVPSGYSDLTVKNYRKLRLAAYPAGNGISWLRSQNEASLWLLLGITGLVLLIACTNLANLMLARAGAREREISVRLAIGASRSRITRQLMSEALLVAIAGAVLGVCLARALSGAIIWLLTTQDNPLHLDLSTDWRMLAFTAATAILTCIIFGLTPALRLSRIRAGHAIATGARGLTATRERFSFQRLLVSAQIAISLVLLVGALLFVRSFTNLITLDPGFREGGILAWYMSFREMHLPPDRIRTLNAQLLDDIRAIPGVQSAAMTTHGLLDGSSWTLGIDVNATRGASKFTWVSPDYFKTVETPMLAGRDFSAQDTRNSKPVLIVNQTFVRHYLQGRKPLGQVVRSLSEPNYPATEYEIVGVGKDSKYSGLREEIPPQAFAPFPLFAQPTPWSIVYVRSSAPLSSLAESLKKRIGDSYPQITAEGRVFKTEIQNGLARERMMAALSGFFGLLAAILVSIGLYGVVSYIVVCRRNEIGIRMALGASRQGVVGMIMRETALLLAIGVAAGFALSFFATRSASALLFGVQPQDPLTFAASGALLALITAVASFWPALRGSRLEPMAALRFE